MGNIHTVGPNEAMVVSGMLGVLWCIYRLNYRCLVSIYFYDFFMNNCDVIWDW